MCFYTLASSSQILTKYFSLLFQSVFLFVCDVSAVIRNIIRLVAQTDSLLQHLCTSSHMGYQLQMDSRIHSISCQCWMPYACHAAYFPLFMQSSNDSPTCVDYWTSDAEDCSSNNQTLQLRCEASLVIGFECRRKASSLRSRAAVWGF